VTKYLLDKLLKKRVYFGSQFLRSMFVRTCGEEVHHGDRSLWQKSCSCSGGLEAEREGEEGFRDKIYLRTSLLQLATPLKLPPLLNGLVSYDSINGIW
jgi:hypothetical protein